MVWARPIFKGRKHRLRALRGTCASTSQPFCRRDRSAQRSNSRWSQTSGVWSTLGNPDKTGELHNPKPSFQSEIGSEISGKLRNMWNVFSEETIRMLFATDCLCGLVHIDCTGFFMGQWSAINMSPQKWHRYAIVGHKYQNIVCQILIAMLAEKYMEVTAKWIFRCCYLKLWGFYCFPLGSVISLFFVRLYCSWYLKAGGVRHVNIPALVESTKCTRKKPWKTGKPWFSTGFSWGWCTIAVAIDWSRNL